MAEAARRLQLDGARAYQRYETGENRPDAHVVDRIERVSKGAVGPLDIHRQRLAWLRANKPELFELVFREAAE